MDWISNIDDKYVRLAQSLGLRVGLPVVPEGSPETLDSLLAFNLSGLYATSDQKDSLAKFWQRVDADNNPKF